MIITWATDIRNAVFDRSHIMDVTENEPYNEEDYLLDDERFKLTEAGVNIYWQWYEDASLGYDLCYGRMQGLAADYTQWQLYELLTTNNEYSTPLN